MWHQSYAISLGNNGQRWKAPSHTFSIASPKPVRRFHIAFRKDIFEIIVGSEPTHLSTLDRLIDIANNLSLEDDQKTALRAMALARFRKYQKTMPELASRYVAVLFWLDGAAAARALIKWLTGAKPSKRSALTITVLALLFGRNDPVAASSLETIPVDALKQLVLFAYQQVKPEGDNAHDGPYTPNLRDDAEGARGSLLKALIDTEGASAYRAVLSLSSHRDMKAHRIRFRELARRMADRDADLFAWTPQEVVQFARHHTAAIKTGGQLYRVAQAVIHEVAWGFENADASSRAVLETAADENAVQHWLADQMKQRANGRYHATREPEVAEGNMPDVLVSAVGAPVEVAVEAKHGDKGWSTNTLENSLRGQLAEDYLRPGKRRHGIFVVTNHSKRRWTDPNTGKRLNFTDMIAYLNRIAGGLTRNGLGEIEVVVIGLDATRKQRRRSIPRHSLARSKEKSPILPSKRRGVRATRKRH